MTTVELLDQASHELRCVAELISSTSSDEEMAAVAFDARWLAHRVEAFIKKQPLAQVTKLARAEG